jgi:hypothetical protein
LFATFAYFYEKEILPDEAKIYEAAKNLLEY